MTKKDFQDDLLIEFIQGQIKRKMLAGLDYFYLEYMETLPYKVECFLKDNGLTYSYEHNYSGPKALRYFIKWPAGYKPRWKK